MTVSYKVLSQPIIQTLYNDNNTLVKNCQPDIKLLSTNHHTF